MIVVGIIRDGRTIVPTGDDQMLSGDEVYFAVESGHVGRAMASFGQEETEAHRIIIVGGGNIGLFLAEDIEKNHRTVTAKVIELGTDRAQLVAQALSDTVVVNGDALDPEILDEANIGATDTIVTVTNDDEVNVLAALLAKRSGCRRAITLVNNQTYEALITTLGIDVVVVPRAITVSTILQHIRRGRILTVRSLRDGVGEVIEAEALDTSSVVGTPLREIKLDKGIIIGAIVRDGEVLVPRGDTVIRVKDRVVLFAASRAVKKVEKMFAVRLEYF